jgi:hypothetical protein
VNEQGSLSGMLLDAGAAAVRTGDDVTHGRNVPSDGNSGEVFQNDHAKLPFDSSPRQPSTRSSLSQ